MNEDIKAYIEKWNRIKNPKPKNDPDFINLFTEFAKQSNYENWDFTGENHYCGYTAAISEFPKDIPVSGFEFEFAYDNGFVKVFTGHHNGFWVPEYISLNGEDAEELLSIIKAKLLEWAGLTQANSEAG